ncbi:hypothetical protein L3i22_037010 [Actinoplanes sp. L3-i22]|nr:hypothetical protein L3i22_037010 [Actinoplanes sp. L3-i22]
MVSAIATSVLLLGAPVPAWADPPAPAAGAPQPGWTVGDRSLTWRSDRVIPPGDAAVEFWSGDTLLGRAKSTTDLQTFVLPEVSTGKLTDLQVRIGGKRVDATAPTSLQRRVTSPPATAPANPVDPGVSGPYATTTGEYTLPGLKLTGYPTPIEMRAVVVVPTKAPGKRPLALFLHGRHWTCYSGTELSTISLDWPCAPGAQPVASYRGYLQAQQLLASQGYVTVSISANAISAQDNDVADLGGQARSALVRTHLAHWADWAGAKRKSAPAIVRAAPPADLSKVFLMGHSRGGEGVSRAALDSLNPPPAGTDDYHGKVRWTIRGLLLIGPTAFGQNPQPNVPSATILPGCDGDVSDLQGQMYVDESRGLGAGTALHSALYVIGANHNYFNTEWTPGQSAGPAADDFFDDPENPDPLCTPGVSPQRLTPQQEQQVGATYIATAARLFVGGDDRARPLLDGTGVRAPSAGPATVLAHAIGANRSPVIVPEPALGVRGARLCEQVPADPAAACRRAGEYGTDSPHFVPFENPEPGRWAVALTGGTTARLRPANAMPVTGSRALALRLIVAPNAGATPVTVAVTDERGRRTELGTATVTGVPGTDRTTSYWGQEVRLALPRGIRAVRQVDLTTGGAGPAWLIDAWGWRAGTPAVKAAALDRVDVGDLRVPEGDSGTRTYRVPVTAYGAKAAKVRLFLNGKSWVTSVKPGHSTLTVPISVTGNDTYGGDRAYPLTAKAAGNAVVGGWIGGVHSIEDEPMPTVTITPAVATATEGAALTWQVQLSGPAADDYLYVVFTPLAPVSGPELSSTDVDPEWFSTFTGEDPLPSRPLSSTAVQLFIAFEPGVTSGEITIPTIADSLPEGAEHVHLRAQLYPPDFSRPADVGFADGTLTD